MASIVSIEPGYYRIPLPSERPRSGSFLGPNTMRAITSTTMSSIGPIPGNISLPLVRA